MARLVAQLFDFQTKTSVVVVLVRRPAPAPVALRLGGIVMRRKGCEDIPDQLEGLERELGLQKQSR